VNLKAKQGRNQKGLCFVSSEDSDFEKGVYEIIFNGKSALVDIRKSAQIPMGIIILDNRIFFFLDCEENADVTLAKNSSDISQCSELDLFVASLKKIDSKSIAEAISKRISDLQDDFEGLILQKNQRIVVERLGIQFTVNSIGSINDSCGPCRVIWNNLEKIHLTPVTGVPAYNIICVIELGAAAHIEDVIQNSTSGDTTSISRYQATLAVLDQIISDYPGYGTNSYFSGFVYSDEVVAFSVFDSQTGTPVEISSLYSKSLLESFSQWVRKDISIHKNKPSNPGVALSEALIRGFDFSQLHEQPTVILFCSSGVHSHGPNPVKIVKKSQESHKIPIICVCIGAGSNKAVLEEIASITEGMVVEINSMSDVSKINDIIKQYFENRG